MDTQHNIEERLWNFIDGSVTAEEKTVIEQLLESDAVWKAKYHELLDINTMLQSSELEAPSLAVQQKCNGRNFKIAYSSCYKILYQ